MRFVSVCGLLIIFGVQGTPAGVTPADSLYSAALSLQERAKHDSAVVLFDAAASLFGAANDIGGRVKCLIGSANSWRSKGQFEKSLEALRMTPPAETELRELRPLVAAQRSVTLGAVYRQTGKYDTALTLASSALLLHQRGGPDTTLLADIYTLFAGTYLDLGRHDSALAYNRRVLSLFTGPDLKVSAALNSIAGMYESRGEYGKALEHYERALAMRIAALGPQHPDIANIYNNIAAVYFRTGDADRSLEYYFKSLSIMQGTLDGTNPAFGVRYNNIAMSYRAKGEFGTALEYGERSKALFVRAFGPEHPNVAGAVNNIGRILFDMKQYRRALEAYREAYALWKAKLGPTHPNVLQSCYNIGEAYGKLGENEEAVSWLTQSLDLRRRTLGEKNVKTSQSYAGLGALHADAGRPDSALPYFQRAIIALVEDFSDSSITADPDAPRSLSDLDLLGCLMQKAEALAVSTYGRSKKERLQAALSTYEHAARVAERIRRDMTAEGSKLQFGTMAFAVLDRGIATALTLRELTKDAAYAAAAWSFAERGKAGVLLDAIAESEAKRFAGIPDSVLDREAALRADIAFTETQLAREREKKEKADRTKLSQRENILFDLRRASEELTARLERDYPRYYELKRQTAVVSPDSVRRSLPDRRTALLEYVVGEKGTTLFVLTKGGFSVRRLPLAADTLSALVKRFRRSVQSAEGTEHIALGHELYTRLIAPAATSLRSVERLIIVPDGILHYLPFEALTMKPAPSTPPADYSGVPYLVTKYDVGYQLSAGLFMAGRWNGASEERTAHGMFAGIAPVFPDPPAHSAKLTPAERITRSRMVDGERFSELKESEREVEEIKRLFDERRKPATLFLRGGAQESVLRTTEAERYRYIHIATHGIINEERPELSGIVFAAPDERSGDDGVLYLGEVYNLELGADLVVLSACETGLGTIVRGEGMLGLTRGFLYAGARSLVVSLWQVGDRSTADLMTHFYAGVLNGRPYSAALRDAKRAMIAGKRHSHPVEWSPFVLTGR